MPTSPLPGDSSKAELRAQVRARRAALTPGQRRVHSEQIRQRLRALPEAAGDTPVLAYAASPREVDLDDLLTEWIAHGRAVWLPWVEGEQLGIARVRDLRTDLTPGHHGIREPRPAGRVPADLSGLGMALIPGVAYSPAGARLGSGGGHFDRLLARRSASLRVIGVAFECQLVPTLSEQPHDRRVDIVVTERRVLRPSPTGAVARP